MYSDQDLIYKSPEGFQPGALTSLPVRSVTIPSRYTSSKYNEENPNPAKYTYQTGAKLFESTALVDKVPVNAAPVVLGNTPQMSTDFSYNGLMPESENKK